ncbi:MAG TPA: serine hydrolase [Gaiella sp.]|nr:serine hydrolase [Gaiella sp.]
MTATPPPPPAPPVIERPAPFQASYGLVSGRAAPGATRVVVRVDGRIVGKRELAGRSFTLDVPLPLREVSVRVETVDGRGRRAGRTVRHVLGLPRAARPRLRAPRLDEALQHRVRRLVAAFPGAAGVYVENLGTGQAAAWNASATFPAASTLKLAIAVTYLARAGAGAPAPGSSSDRLLRSMLLASDNAAANSMLVSLGGSTSGGGSLVNSLMRSIGLERTEMYGGYLIGTSLDAVREPTARGVPLNVVDQPAWGVGKATTAADLAQLHRTVWLASAGLGPLAGTRAGLDAAEARYLLYLLAHVQVHSKLGRAMHGGAAVLVLHKAGWIDAARHDAGLVVWPGGIASAAVLTYRSFGPGRRADILAGDVAEAALSRYRG